MNGEKLLDAMNYLPDELLEQTDRLRRKKRSNWQHWAALAACLCLVAGSFFLIPQARDKNAAGSSAPEMSLSTTAQYLVAEVCSVQPQQLSVILSEEYESRTVLVDLADLTDVPTLAPGDRIRIYLTNNPTADGANIVNGKIFPSKIEIQEE